MVSAQQEVLQGRLHQNTAHALKDASSSSNNPLILFTVTRLEMFPSKVLSKADLIIYNFDGDVASLISFIFPADSPHQKCKYACIVYLFK